MKKSWCLISIFLIFIFLFGILTVALPKKDYSQREKRVLAEAEAPTAQGLADGSYVEDLTTYLSDHFAWREFWVGVNAYYNKALGRSGESGIYAGKDGYLIPCPAELDEAQLLRNLSSMSRFAQTNHLQATLMPIPSPGYAMPEKMPALHGEYADDRIFSLTEENRGEMVFLDIRKAYAETELPLFYRTDHHLTSAGSLYTYQWYCGQKGLKTFAFTLTETEPGFYGTGYAKSGLWLTKPDTVELYTSGNTSFTVTITDGKTEKTSQSLYFKDHFEREDKYPVFLDGNHALVRVQNGQNQNGQKLLIVKDSYAHCFTTFLAENYQEIVLVDLRYYRESMTKLVQAEGFSEVLFLFGSENLASSTEMGRLNL